MKGTISKREVLSPVPPDEHLMYSVTSKILITPLIITGIIL